MPLNAPVDQRPSTIVKVAISFYTSASEPQVKICDRFNNILVILGLSDCPGLEDAIGDHPLKIGFFRARIVNNKVVLDERVPDPGWE